MYKAACALTALLLLWGGQARAVGGETFYVKSKTDCTFNGTGLVNACATSGGGPGAFRQSIALVCGAAVGQVDGGDTVNFTGNWFGLASAENGTTYMMTFGCPGSIGLPVVYNFAAARVDCNREVLRGMSVGAMNYFTLNNLTVQHCGTNSGTGYGISVDGGVSTFDMSATLEAPIVNDVQSTDGLSVGIRVVGSNVTIHNPKVTSISDDGIWANGDNTNVTCDDNKGTTCYVKDVGLSLLFTGDCFQFGAAVLNHTNTVTRAYCDHRLIAQKQCAISNTAGLLRVLDTVCLGAQDFINGNTIGIYSEGKLEARRNYINGFNYGIDAASLATAVAGESPIIGNIITHFGWYGITSGSAIPAGVTTTIVNNTVDGTGSDLANSRCLNLAGTAAAVINATNNFVGNCNFGFVKAGAATPTLLSNWDFGNNTRYSGFASGSTLGDPQFIKTNPVIAIEYKLKTTSPMLRAGVFVNPYSDVRGCPFWNPPSIGAYEQCAGELSSSSTTSSAGGTSSSNGTSSAGGVTP